MGRRTLYFVMLLAAAPILASLPASVASAAVPGQGGFTDRWDWHMHRRTIRFSIEPGLELVPPDSTQDSVRVSLAGAIRFAASNWSNAATGWRFDEVPWGAVNSDLRFLAMPANKKFGSWQNLILDIPRDWDDNEPYGAPDPETWSQPPGDWLAYFAAESTYFSEVKNQLKVVKAKIVVNTDAWWHTAIGTPHYDPRTVMMHELGHAARLEHDDRNTIDDEETEPVGSAPGAGVLSIDQGVDAILQTTPEGDDVVVGGDIFSGADGIVSTSPIEGFNPNNILGGPNVMSTNDRSGRHGVNPGADHPPGSAYSLAPTEWNTAKASAVVPEDKPVPGLAPWALGLLALGIGALSLARLRRSGSIA